MAQVLTDIDQNINQNEMNEQDPLVSDTPVPSPVDKQSLGSDCVAATPSSRYFTPSPSTQSIPDQTSPCFGPYVPILRQNDIIVVDPKSVVDYYDHSKPNRLLGHVLPGDAIIEAPSMVTPLLLKKKSHPPPLPTSDSEPGEHMDSVENRQACPSESADGNIDSTGSDEVEIIRVLEKGVQVSTQDKSIPPKRKRSNIYDDLRRATVNSLTAKNSAGLNTISTNEDDYYKSSAADLMLSIGLSRVLEFNLQRDIRNLSRKADTTKNLNHSEQFEAEIESTKAKLAPVALSNRPYKLKPQYECPHCPFRTEFAMVLDEHLRQPHKKSSGMYKCNWCSFKIKDKNIMSFHVYSLHKKFCKFEPPILNEENMCQYCSFHSRSKKRLEFHRETCRDCFNQAHNLAPHQFEGTDGLPGITSAPITKELIATYEQVLRDLRSDSYNPHNVGVLDDSGRIEPAHIVPRRSRAYRRRGQNSEQIVSADQNTNTQGHTPAIDPINVENSSGQVSATQDGSLDAAGVRSSDSCSLGGALPHVANPIVQAFADSNVLRRPVDYGQRRYIVFPFGRRSGEQEEYQQQTVGLGPRGVATRDVDIASNRLISLPSQTMTPVRDSQNPVNFPAPGSNFVNTLSAVQSSVNYLQQQQSNPRQYRRPNNHINDESSNPHASGNIATTITSQNSRLITNRATGDQVANRIISNPLGHPPSGSGATSGEDLAGLHDAIVFKEHRPFGICEICDSYLENTKKLRLHLLRHHGVEVSRHNSSKKPPLKCQKCDWNFYTDTGLERHLLGQHGLITKTLAEAVDNGADSGRCPHCGLAFARKLVNHVKDAHGIKMKWANLQYKCRICLAKFDNYKLFQDHTSSVHKNAQVLSGDQNNPKQASEKK